MTRRLNYCRYVNHSTRADCPSIQLVSLSTGATPTNSKFNLCDSSSFQFITFGFEIKMGRGGGFLCLSFFIFMLVLNVLTCISTCRLFKYPLPH